MMLKTNRKNYPCGNHSAWYAMFNPTQTVLIAAHKYTGAQEIMTRIPYVYETCLTLLEQV